MGSEDGGSTGSGPGGAEEASAAAAAGGASINRRGNNQHQHTSSSSSSLTSHPHHHARSGRLKALTVKTDHDKTRRPSSDSARSSHHDEADSPREIPLYQKRRSEHAEESGEDAAAAGGNGGSRPGTPLFDERPDSGEVPACRIHQARHPTSFEPMSLPLPSFARQVLSPVAKTPSASSAKVTAAAPAPTVAPPAVKERDPRLKSPGLKSPPILKSPVSAPPGGSIRGPALHQYPTPSSAPPDPTRPQDPRLVAAAGGLLQVAHSPKLTTPNLMSPPGGKTPSRHEDTTSDTERDAVDPSSMSLEERLKALDEKYQKWSSGSSKPSSATLAGSNTAGIASSTPATPGSLSATGSSLLPGLKLGLGLKPSQPSPIVQRLLSRKSVFDEDSKRLETISQESTKTMAEGTDVEKSPAAAVGVVSMNFGVGYNTISTLSDKPVPSLGSSSPLVAGGRTTVTTPTATPKSSSSSLPKSTTGPPSESSGHSTSSGTTAPERVRLTGHRKSTESSAEAVRNHRNERHEGPQSHPDVGSKDAAHPAKTAPVSVAEALTTRSPAERMENQTSAVEDLRRPTVGQVKPLAVAPAAAAQRLPPLPNALGTSTNTTPIKPLSDAKQRPVSTKPSATVTPTIKSTVAAPTSVIRRSGLSTCTNTTVSSVGTVASATAPKISSSPVSSLGKIEKGEASSTTSSPKEPTSNHQPIVVESVRSSDVAKVEQISPVSSTEVCTQVAASPAEEEGSVSSTTRDLETAREVSAAQQSKEGAKIARRESESSSSHHQHNKKDASKGMEKFSKVDELFAPTTVIPSAKPKSERPKDAKKTSEVTKEAGGSKKPKESSSSSSHGNSHHHHHSTKDKKAPVNSFKKLKEKQSKDLQGFLQATDTLHVKKDPKREALQHVRKDSESSDGKKEKKERKDHHHHLSSGKRRMSSHENEDSPHPAKVAKLKGEPDAEQPETKRAKLSSEGSSTAAPELKMGRIPKIKKEVGAEDFKAKQDSSSVHREKRKEDERKHKKDSSGKRSGGSHHQHHHHQSSGLAKDRSKYSSQVSLASTKSGREDGKSGGSSSKKNKERKDKMMGKLMLSADEEDSRKKELSKFKHREHRRELERRKSTSSKKKLSDSESESYNSEEDKSEKVHSIFDDPVFDQDNPVYFSMYDKVKSRRCKKTNQDELRRQQEALKRFSKIKKKAKKRVKSSDSSESESEEEDKSKKPKSKRLLSSSSDDDDDEEADDKKPRAKKPRSMKLSDSDDSSKRVKRKKMSSISSLDDSDDSDEEPEIKSSSAGRKKTKPIKSATAKPITTSSSNEDDEEDKVHKARTSKHVSRHSSSYSQKKSISSHKGPKMSATAKVKAEPLSSDSDEESEALARNKSAATAVLVPKKKSTSSSLSKIGVNSSASESEARFSQHGSSHRVKANKSKKLKRPEQPARNDRAPLKQKKSDKVRTKTRTEKNEAEKKIMSSIFGSSSEDEVEKPSAAAKVIKSKSSSSSSTTTTSNSVSVVGRAGTTSEKPSVLPRESATAKVTTLSGVVLNSDSDDSGPNSAAVQKSKPHHPLLPTRKEDGPALLSDSDSDRASRPPTPGPPDFAPTNVRDKDRGGGGASTETKMKARHSSGASLDGPQSNESKKAKKSRRSSSSHSESGSVRDGKAAPPHPPSIFEPIKVELPDPDSDTDGGKNVKHGIMSPKMTSPKAVSFAQNVKSEAAEKIKKEVTVKAEPSSSCPPQEDPTKRAVISQEETAQAVTALLGDSFGSKEQTGETDFDKLMASSPEQQQHSHQQQEQQEEETETKSAVAGIVQDSDESALTLAGLQGDIGDGFNAAAASPEKKIPAKEKPAASDEEEEEEEDNETIGNIAAEIRRSFEEDKSPAAKDVNETTTTTPPSGGRGGSSHRGRGGGRGRGRGRGAAAAHQQPETPSKTSPTIAAAVSPRGRGSRGRGRGRGAHHAAVEEANAAKAAEAVAVPVATGRGRGRGGRARGKSPATTSTRR
jgi:hypothetical protein